MYIRHSMRLMESMKKKNTHSSVLTFTGAVFSRDSTRWQIQHIQSENYCCCCCYHHQTGERENKMIVRKKHPNEWQFIYSKHIPKHVRNKVFHFEVLEKLSVKGNSPIERCGFLILVFTIQYIFLCFFFLCCVTSTSLPKQ